ncbi:hypothetical protein ACVNS2_18495 [Paenibacillus caseinilyticus]|uniref:Uncharacterized protein n=2 Tax=Paenibacillus mucilaginosus TaxID=61624 RepID=I0BJU3_9BACL|nr:hypothetical protein [Paenibacillus mucilaginosus]AEI41876.1 hypothetical protein KNP414_03318 [Paenibacillus mucilaginosus KNP414]AFH62640.1 hypothetical protein B2K_18250 [Paenibacillus mucilaginosus K02]WFA19002.1 hypothetical protein ERY13_17845 [Paenibacillus mucilaginosus]
MHKKKTTLTALRSAEHYLERAKSSIQTDHAESAEDQLSAALLMITRALKATAKPKGRKRRG